MQRKNILAIALLSLAQFKGAYLNQQQMGWVENPQQMECSDGLLLGHGYQYQQGQAPNHHGSSCFSSGINFGREPAMNRPNPYGYHAQQVNQYRSLEPQFNQYQQQGYNGNNHFSGLPNNPAGSHLGAEMWHSSQEPISSQESIQDQDILRSQREYIAFLEKHIELCNRNPDKLNTKILDAFDHVGRLQDCIRIIRGLTCRERLKQRLSKFPRPSSFGPLDPVGYSKIQDIGEKADPFLESPLPAGAVWGGSSSSSSGLIPPSIHGNKKGKLDDAISEHISFNSLNKVERMKDKLTESYENLEICFDESFRKELEEAIDLLDLEKLVGLYGGTEAELFSVFDDELKEAFGENFTLVGFISAIASNFDSTDLSKIIDQGFLKSDLIKNSFTYLDKIVRFRVAAALHRLANMMQRSFKNREEFIKRAFFVIYKGILEVQGLKFLVDGVEPIISNPVYYGQMQKALRFGIIDSDHKGQRARHKQLNREVISARDSLQIDPSECIRSVQKFIKELNQLIKERWEYDSRKCNILAFSTGEIMKNIFYNERSEDAEMIFAFIEENKRLINSFFKRSSSEKTKGMILRLNRSVGNQAEQTSGKTKGIDYNWMVGSIRQLINRLHESL